MQDGKKADFIIFDEMDSEIEPNLENVIMESLCDFSQNEDMTHVVTLKKDAAEGIIKILNESLIPNCSDVWENTRDFVQIIYNSDKTESGFKVFIEDLPETTDLYYFSPKSPLQYILYKNQLVQEAFYATVNAFKKYARECVENLSEEIKTFAECFEEIRKGVLSQITIIQDDFDKVYYFERDELPRPIYRTLLKDKTKIPHKRKIFRLFFSVFKPY